MAESPGLHPSLEGIFHILAQVPEEKLIDYKHKLSCERQNRRSSQLLQTMILLTLKRETEARRSLDALRGDPVAARISRYCTATANTANVVPPLQKEEGAAEMWLAVARIYSLLVDAKWCCHVLRDEAYRVAVAAFRSGGGSKDRLRGLADEALEKCGMGFMFGSGETGKALRVSDPVPVTRVSNTVPVPRASDPVPVTRANDLVPVPRASDPVLVMRANDLVPVPRVSDTVPVPRANDQVPVTRVNNLVPVPRASDPVPVMRANDLVPVPRVSDTVPVPRANDQVPVTRVNNLVPVPRASDPVPFLRVNDPVLFPKASDPVPVLNSLDPQPLRSTGSPTSIVSHLEISHSLTVPFQTHSVHYGTGISKLCGEIRDTEERNRDESLTGRTESGDLKGSRCSSSDPSVSPERSVQCPEPVTGKHVSPRSLPHDPRISSADSTQYPRNSVADPYSQKPPSNSVSGPPPAVSSSSEPQEFFTFVVVHADEDEAIACRVKARLESMGIPDGATYSEDFLVPGRCQLGCFENALEDSAFTLFLLTENFKSRLCAYQTNTALMDSLTHFCKANTVIPFLPKERPLKTREMPLLLKGLVPLDENSPVFAKRVKKTFREEDIRRKKADWSVRRQNRERERLQEQNREYQQQLQRLSELSMNMTSLQGFPGMPQPPPGPDLTSLCPSFMFPQGFGGARPPLIIQNAQMVQIGDCNNMQVERTNATLGTAEENGIVNP
ncbi:TIR domain-containing adapter molecule 1 [Anolis carolinensis]|uniref:TIR domain-containing adapter molecule 1 n=1 Tax=Anolis carolinensis TaxID=28377 RepID=H9GE62_ANOCA|nr:PREDICTED: TIR domain-containing adapter molecule 1 [Anolis carolinensis]|eukprot:XP_008120431.1 PREDICTED: TIR domain-containing adapter molecule 1 [Anolis carolinensis]